MYKKRAIKFRRIFQRRILINVLSLVITQRVCVLIRMQSYAIFADAFYQRKGGFLVLAASGYDRPEELGQFLLHEQHHSVPE